MRIFYFFLIFLFFQNKAYTQNDVILPLSVGNYWVFQNSLKVEVTGSTIITYNNSDFKVYYWQWDNSEVKWLLRNQNDGLWAYGYYSPSDTIIDPEILFKYPTFVGDTWQNNWSLVRDTILVECTSQDTSIITPAGEFSCYEYYENEQSQNKRSIKNLLFQIFSGSPEITPNSVTQKRNGNYLLFSPKVGYVQSYYLQNNEINVLSLLSYNVTTSINEKKSLVKKFILQQNFPNPFNPGTVIRFNLPYSEHVSIDIYNSLGQKIDNILNKKISAGNHSVLFKSGKLPSGIYFYRLTAGYVSEVKKMLLVR